MWKPFRLTVLQDERDRRNQNTVGLGRAFHADLRSWKCSINRKLQAGEVVSVPCYIALKRPPKRNQNSDASLERGR